MSSNQITTNLSRQVDIQQSLNSGGSVYLATNHSSQSTQSKTISTEQLLNNWQTVLSDVQDSARANNRPVNSVKLIAVSKTKPVSMIKTLAAAGQIDFAENYLQEAVEKITQLSDTQADSHICWHYIGHIQRNKTRDIAQNFSWVHTLEREVIAKRLHDQRPDDMPALNVLIQVNIDDEASKSGCKPDELNDLVTAISGYSNLCLRGLMVIPAQMDSTQSTHNVGKNAFARTKRLFEQIKNEHPKLVHWDTLSMGMSADIADAIAQGSTMVRVGSAIFGKRG